MSRPELSIDGSGPRPTIAKSAAEGPARRRLEHEIEMLRLAEHPGVVPLVGADDDDGRLVVRLAYCGSRTLATAGRMTVARVAGTVAALATTVADLHDLGIAHTRLTGDHVVIAADGRPVVCGLADAVAGDEARHRRADDVHALGVLLRDLLAEQDDLAPIPTSRLGRRGAWSGYQRRALLNLADQATSDEPLLRPTARQLALNIRSTVPDATLVDHGPGPTDGTAQEGFAPSSHDSRSGRLGALVEELGGRRLAALGAGCLALVGLTTLWFTGAPDRAELVARGDPPAEPAATFTPTTEAALPDLPTTTLAPSTSTTAPAVETPARQGDPGAPASGCATLSTAHETAAMLAGGEPCPVEVRFASGVLTVDTEQFHLGLGEAAVAIGDFRCDGAPIAAVLDQATGHVFVFDTWAEDEQPVTARSIRQVEPTGRLLAEPVGGVGCHRLVALDRYGIRYVIDLEEEAS